MKFRIYGTWSLVLVVVALAFSWACSASTAQTPAPGKQIEAAVLPAPDAMKEGAKIYGYDDSGELVTLREGDGQLICMADKPGDDKFHVACYYKELEPFMAVGRKLRKQGLSHSQVDSVRRVRIKSGELDWPETSTALYSVSGPADGYDYDKGQLLKGSPLYVVYMPYATTESTGFDKSPAVPGAPWLMEAGTPWAHLMIMPEVSVDDINGK